MYLKVPVKCPMNQFSLENDQQIILVYLSFKSKIKSLKLNPFSLTQFLEF